MSKTEDRLITAFAELRKLEAEVREREKTIDSLKRELQALIPPGTTRAGITHIVTQGKSVSYAKVVAAMREALIPKTKLAAADEILATYTATTERHMLRAEDDGE